MYIPKFVRKIILKVAGTEQMIPPSRPLPRESLIGFSDKELDEIILGRSWERIDALRKELLLEIDAALPVKSQRHALKSIVAKAIEKFAHLEAGDRR